MIFGSPYPEAKFVELGQTFTFGRMIVKKLASF